jgi:ectoine hydroxylase-related dioxygenase (phytanoyl-CoA dioxygenase family)
VAARTAREAERAATAGAEREAPGPLAEAELRRYREDGYLPLGRVLDDGEVAALRREEERFRLPVAYGGRDNPTLFVNVQLCHRSEAVRRVATAGRHIAMVRQLLGPDVCLTHQQFVTKLPDGADARSDIPWHQDDGYGRLEPMTDVTVWIALVDTDETNGCLWILPGSQRRGLLPHDAAGVNPLLREVAVDGSGVALPLRAGQAVAFGGLTLHGSGPNRSAGARPGLFLRYCEPGTVMVSEGNKPVLEDAHSWMVAGEAR